MIIKSLKISGFKNIPDSTLVEYKFYPHTIISGENFAGKTSICEAICWVFCGCNINGGSTYDTLLKNNESDTMSVEAEFVANNGLTNIVRRSKTRNTSLFLNNAPITQNHLLSFIGSKEIFMSTFVTGYFQRYSPREAREMLMEVLPPVSAEDILSKMPYELINYIPANRVFYSNELLKQKRVRLKEIEKEELFLKGQIKAITDNIVNSIPNTPENDNDILDNIKEYEKKRLELLKIKAAMEDDKSLIAQRELLRKEYEHLKSKLIQVEFNPGDTCPSCHQVITEVCIQHLKEYAANQNQTIQAQLNEIRMQGKVINTKIDEEEKHHNSQINTNKEYADELEAIEQSIHNLRIQYAETLKAQTLAENNKKAESNLIEINLSMENLLREKNNVIKAIAAASTCNSIRNEVQFKNISKYLDRVSIRLEKLVKSTGELKEVFEVLYDNKEVMLLSNSERVRAALEISNLINNRTGLKLPIFIDNAESITQYNKPDTQVFEAVVVRNKPLTIEEG